MTPDRRDSTSADNGRLSKGPATPDGKRRSSQNARRHGLLSRCIVLEDESAHAFQTLLAQHIERFQPADAVELAIVEEMVASMWRLRRSWAIETRIIDAAADRNTPEPLSRMASAFTSCAASSALPLAHRYETRLHKIYQRALQNLLLLRTVLRAPQPAPDPPYQTNLLSTGQEIENA